MTLWFAEEMLAGQHQNGPDNDTSVAFFWGSDKSATVQASLCARKFF